MLCFVFKSSVAIFYFVILSFLLCSSCKLIAWATLQINFWSSCSPWYLCIRCAQSECLLQTSNEMKKWNKTGFFSSPRNKNLHISQNTNIPYLKTCTGSCASSLPLKVWYLFFLLHNMEKLGPEYFSHLLPWFLSHHHTFQSHLHITLLATC